jgi:hypothetical protein
MEELSTNLSQRQLIRITRFESPEFIDPTFAERCLERKTERERRGWGLNDPQPYLFTDGACAGLGLQGATGLPSQKAKNGVAV